jgi:ubiquinone/menaquinone biosynthesis C-methylase UbiE
MPDVTASDPETAKRRIVGVFDRSAATFDAVGVDFFTPVARGLVAQAGVQPGGQILDVGCGRGAVLFAARAAVGPDGQVTGIDLSPRMVELTRADAAERGFDNIHVAQGDAERPDFPVGSFDAVLAGLSLHLLPNPAAALECYSRLLGPDGVLAFSTYAAQDPAFDAAMDAVGSFIPGEGADGGQRHGRFGSAAGIEELLADCGFGAVDMRAVDYESRFIDADHWLAWAWSHGQRVTLERVPDADLLAASEAAKVAFQAARTPKGDYAIRTTVRFTVAHPERQGH